MIFDPNELTVVAQILGATALTAALASVADHYWFAPRRRQRQHQLTRRWPAPEPTPPDWVNHRPHYGRCPRGAWHEGCDR